MSLWYLISHTLRQSQRTLIGKGSIILEVQEAKPIPEKFAEAVVTKRGDIVSILAPLCYDTTVC
jgi:hypothetical protein